MPNKIKGADWLFLSKTNLPPGNLTVTTMLNEKYILTKLIKSYIDVQDFVFYLNRQNKFMVHSWGWLIEEWFYK